MPTSGVSQKDASRSNRSYFQVAAVLSKSSLHGGEFLLCFLQSPFGENDMVLVVVKYYIVLGFIFL